MARIISRRGLTPRTILFTLEAPLVARAAEPGQFVMVRAVPEGERIPITITTFDRGAGTITLVIQEVGATSRLLCGLPEGGEILDLVGPLGTPAPLPERGHVVLVGGGFGAGAILTLAEALRARGLRITAIVGARTAELLILREQLEPLCDAYHACTDDGSLGFRGRVGERLSELISDGGGGAGAADGGFTDCFVVGPTAMMRAVSAVTGPAGLRTFVSLDPIMVDGTGMCGSCRVTVHGETRFACVDGPFFDGHGADFDEIAARARTYSMEERLAAGLHAREVR